MNIIGERIYLRALEEKDCDTLLEIINDPETERMIGGYSFPTSSLSQRDWLLNKANGKNVFRCAIVPKDNDDEMVGTAILSDIDEKNGIAEAHIKLAKSGQGKGFGSETIMMLVKYGFDQLRLNCIYANVLADNEASNKLFKKCGFEFEGTLKSRLYKDGSYLDVNSYSFIKK